MGVLAGSGVAIAALMLPLWVVSVLKRDVSIVDAFWGPGFVLVAWVAWALSGRPASAPGLVLPIAVSVWGLRLGVYLAWRNWGEPEDARYVAIRKGWPAFWLTSLGVVFGLQGVLLWIVALPVQLAASASPPALGWLDGVGLALALCGVAWETAADLQLARFKADPANQGQVLDRGVWRYSRHPNYFGDFLTWWGLFVLALGRGAPWWTAVGPVVMSVLLLKVSGVPLLEKGMATRRPAYADYVARTSSFFPWPPREAGA